jgi:hypothetical protein
MRSGPWVLVTDGGSGQARSALAAVRALAARGYRPAVTVSGRWSIAAASRHCARRVEVPGVFDPGYADAVRSELAARPYLAVLGASDAALLALGEPVRHLVDKAAIAPRGRRAGLAVPPMQVFGSRDELLASRDLLEYPLVVKPTLSFHSVVRVDSPEALGRVVVADGPVVVQPYLREALHAVVGVAHHGRFVAAAHQRYLRTWPPDCGTACAAVTVAPDRDLESRLLLLLEGYEGIFQAQFAGPYLLDLNPRVYGSLPLAVAAGANLPAIWCDLLRGVDPGEVRARPGVFYRWIEGDVRHVATAIRRGSMGLGAALRSLRPHRAAAHSTESLVDPRPMLSRIGYALIPSMRQLE